MELSPEVQAKINKFERAIAQATTPEHVKEKMRAQIIEMQTPPPPPKVRRPPPPRKPKAVVVAPEPPAPVFIEPDDEVGKQVSETYSARRAKRKARASEL
jgi:hypothetical protein